MRCKIGYSLFQHIKTVQSTVRETAAGTYRLLVGQLLYTDTTLSLQLFPRAQACYCKFLSHPRFRFLHEIPGSFHSYAFQSDRYSPTYSPYIGYIEKFQGLFPLFISINHADRMIALIFLRKLTCHLCQGPSRRYPKRYRNSRSLGYEPDHITSVWKKLFSRTHAGKIHKSLIYGIYIQLRSVCRQQCHNPSAHIPIKYIIAAEHSHTVFLQQSFNLKERCPHLNAQCLCFIAARYDTTVIIGQYHTWSIPQIRTEHPLA